MSRLAPVPSWVTDGWYSNNPFAQQLAIKRWYMPVTSPGEVAASKAFTLAPTMGCASCGKFAFMRPTICHWCSADMERGNG
jgi:hypothetical protein